jgi:hypothetical protein
MSNELRDLGWLPAAGGPHALGLALGRAGRAAVHRDLVGCDYWRRVTAPGHAAAVARMMAATRARFPAIWAEIEGLAEGLGLPVAQVMAWNCRGDLLSNAPDGCTSVMIPGETPVLAHNEDGLPFFRGDCFILDAAPQYGPGFRGFCYPGSIPGHTFAFNDAGLVQTVNNLRLRGVAPDIPRMVLGRAVIASRSLPEALDVLRGGANSGGFHFALCHTAERRILSVEFGAAELSLREIAEPALHANHALHHEWGCAHQIVTQSSADRQARGGAMLRAGAAPLEILRDTAGPGLPIRRDAPDDPDEENTLATAVMRVTKEGVDWSIHDRRTAGPAYSGRSAA